jgi:hypothetical protein
MLEEGWLIFDDFKANAFDNNSSFCMSRKLDSLICALRSDLRCAVADVDFCQTQSREEAERVLRAKIPDLKIEWLFFANDWTACEVNIGRRKRLRYQEELEKMRGLAVSYRIPPDATVIPVTLCEPTGH